MLPTEIKYKRWCDENAYTLAQVFDGDEDYDTSAIADLFDSYYANWWIVDPDNDFSVELKRTYAMAKQRINLYYGYLVNDFNPSALTEMSVSYGQRGGENSAYDYPLSGATVKPSRKDTSKTDAVTDTTTVRKAEEPFKTLNRIGDFMSFEDFFLAQFRDCFTRFTAMTW